MAKRVIVVGGGIIGASFAYHLARGGAEVKLLDAGRQAGGVATPMSWAWINASWGNPEPYFRLRHASMQQWRQLDRDVAGLALQWSGGLLWDLDEPALTAFVREQSAWGYNIRLVDGAEAARLEPAVSQVPQMAAYAADEGAVEPVHAVEKLLQAAEALGADLLRGVRVKRLVEDSGRIVGVMTEDGLLEADEVVLAAGAATNELLAPFGLALAMEAPSGLLVHSEPVGEMLNGLVMAPQLHVRQTVEGGLVAGSDYGGSDPGADPEQAAHALFGTLQGFLKQGMDLRFSHFTLGHRPTPKDGVSAIGRVQGLDGLYLCCTHSGITLAPALGFLGSEDILSGETPKLLNPFAPARILEKA